MTFVNRLYEENTNENDLVLLIIHRKVVTCAHFVISYTLLTIKVKFTFFMEETIVFIRKNMLYLIALKWFSSWKSSLDKNWGTYCEMSGSLLREKSSDSLLKANSVHPFISEDKHTGKHKTADYLLNQMIFSTQI